MFQFSQIAETLTGLFGGQDNDQQEGAPEIMGLLENAGIDLSALEGLGADQIMEVVNNAGIDLSQFSPDQIGEVFQNFNVSNITENIDIGSIAENIFKR